MLEKYADRLMAINKISTKKRSNINTLNSKSLASKCSFTSAQAEELIHLQNYMSQKGFRLSSELSKYITRNKLGIQHPNIADIVTMKNDVKEWDFNGGFPKRIYRIICQELGLRDKGTSARSIKLTSYREQK